MTTQINSRENVIGAGTIATHLIGERYIAARTLALSVGITVEWEYGKVRNSWGDPFGNINEKNPGKNVARPRWEVAAIATWDFFGLPHGTVWTPCYLCGFLFDAWTMDVEHVFGRLAENGGTRPGGILLACSGCNTGKGETRRVSWQTRNMLEDSVAAKVLWRRAGNVNDANWFRRTRRTPGQNSSTRWEG